MKKKLKINRYFLAYDSPCPPQTNLAQSVQLFGRLNATYINTNVLFYYIDRKIVKMFLQKIGGLSSIYMHILAFALGSTESNMIWDALYLNIIYF